MQLLLTIESGHSADAVLIGNVKSYTYLGGGAYTITYLDPHDNELYDIIIKHVVSAKEV